MNDIILRNEFIKKVTNIKAVKHKAYNFKFACHVAFDINKVNYYVKQELKEEANLVSHLPSDRRDLQKAALNKLLSKVPSRVLGKIRE